MNKMALKVLCFVCAVLSMYMLAVDAQAVKTLPCKNVATDATLNQVIVTPCPKLPCQFKRGTNISTEITFTMNADARTATTATTVVHGIIGGAKVPYPTNYKDACKTTGIKCPLKAGAKNVYKAILFVDKVDPKINLYVMWEVQDQTKGDVFCLQLPVTIV